MVNITKHTLRMLYLPQSDNCNFNFIVTAGTLDEETKQEQAELTNWSPKTLNRVSDSALD